MKLSKNLLAGFREGESMVLPATSIKWMTSNCLMSSGLAALGANIFTLQFSDGRGRGRREVTQASTLWKQSVAE